MHYSICCFWPEFIYIFAILLTWSCVIGEKKAKKIKGKREKEKLYRRKELYIYIFFLISHVPLCKLKDHRSFINTIDKKYNWIVRFWGINSRVDACERYKFIFKYRIFDMFQSQSICLFEFEKSRKKIVVDTWSNRLDLNDKMHQDETLRKAK